MRHWEYNLLYKAHIFSIDLVAAFSKFNFYYNGTRPSSGCLSGEIVSNCYGGHACGASVKILI